MIRKTWNRDKWLLTPQPEHARLASLMATSWNFPGAKPGDDVIQAIRRHDDGWKEAEQELPLNAAGAPANFDEMDLSTTALIWERGATKLADDGRPYSAILVAEHFLWLAENQVNLAKLSVRGAVAIGGFIARERGISQKCRTAVETEQGAPIDEEKLKRDLRLLQVCDALSLLLCGDFIGEQVLTDVPYLDGIDQITVSRKSESLSLTLDPLPFKKNLRDHVNAFIIPQKSYESESNLQELLASMKPTHNEVHLGAK